MTVEYDKTPGSAKRHQRTRNGQLVSEVVQKKPDPAPPAAPDTLRIRMVQTVRSRLGVFAAGQVVALPAVTARSWIGFGFAEEDKMLGPAPETK